MEIEAINWKDEFSVGLKSVDKQHQRFLAILNEIGTSIADNSVADKGRDIFFSLCHFSDDFLMKEKMLVNSIPEIDYSYFREKHDQFLTHIQEFKEKFLSSAPSELFLDLYNYLKEEFPHYISYYTPSLINILKKNGVA